MEIDVRFTEGSVLYFNPFVFPDGGTPKPKYFIVLKHVGEKLLLASLPTSKDNVPSFITKSHGCIENPDISFNCYYFIEEKGKLMTKEYVALMQCLALSKSVKRGYRTLLQA